MKLDYLITEEQLKKTKKDYFWLIGIVEPVIKELCQQFNHKNFYVLLTDKYSDILTAECSNDSDRTEMLKRNIDDNLRDKKYSGKVDEECRCEENERSGGNRIFSSSVAVSDSDETIAYLIVTGFEEERDSRFISVVQLLGKVINVMAEMYKKNKELEKQKKFHELLVDASSDGMLSVNMEGIITFINPAGMKILNIDKNVIGKHITEGVDFEPTILHVLKSREGYVDREFRLESKRGTVHFVKTAIPLKDDRGEMIGVLDIFRNINDVKSMVNRMTGAQAKYTVSNIIGGSLQIQEIKKMIKLAGSNDSPVLIQGESGTGKDIIAQAVHNYSDRRQGPFVAVNCLSLPRNLIESELFGYEEDSFSMNTGGRPGKIEMAHGGTLFLNNIAFIPLDLQNKLTKALQKKGIVRIGGFKEIPVDVRIIASSHVNITEMTEEKNFSDGLFKVISNFTIHTPPLRDRREDIEIISNQTLSQYNMMNGTNKKISKEALELLNKWEWPDNVRELENAIEFAYCFAEGDEILPEHLQVKLTKEKPQIKDKRPMTLKEAEAEAVRSALDFTSGNVTQAAKILGIGRNTLYGKIKEYNIL